MLALCLGRLSGPLEQQARHCKEGWSPVRLDTKYGNSQLKQPPDSAANAMIRTTAAAVRTACCCCRAVAVLVCWSKHVLTDEGRVEATLHLHEKRVQVNVKHDSRRRSRYIGGSSLPSAHHQSGAILLQFSAASSSWSEFEPFWEFHQIG